MLSTISAKSEAASSTKSINQEDDEVEENVMLVRQASNYIDNVGGINVKKDKTIEGTNMMSGGEGAVKDDVKIIFSVF